LRKRTMVVRSEAGGEATTCSRTRVEAAACSRAGDKAAMCSGARIEDGRLQRRRDGF
jgi:hypothetical protein